MAEQNFFDAPRALDYNQTAIGSARFTLSESPSGAPIYIPSGSVGNGTLIHTFPVNTNAIEEVYLYVSNFSQTTMNLSMSFATSSAGAFDLTVTNGNKIITPATAQNGPIFCYPGVPHKSTDVSNPLKLYVTTGFDNAVNVFGYVLRYYPKENTNPGLGYSPE
jgi:hypothetical protein